MQHLNLQVHFILRDTCNCVLQAHHYTPLGSPRQLYITYLMTAISLDILDTVSFVDLLWQNKVCPFPTIPPLFHTTYNYECASSIRIFQEFDWNLPFWLEITILCIASSNFILPTFALLKLNFGRNQRILLISDRFWSFLYVVLVSYIPHSYCRMCGNK